MSWLFFFISVLAVVAVCAVCYYVQIFFEWIFDSFRLVREEKANKKRSAFFATIEKE